MNLLLGQVYLVSKAIIEILIDEFIPIIEFICQLTNNLFLLGFIRISHVRFSIFFKSVHEFLKGHHSIETRRISLNTNPDLVRLLFIDLFCYCLVNLWSHFKKFMMLGESRTPKEYRVAIPSAYVAFFVMD
jgi:hypothetical protein